MTRECPHLISEGDETAGTIRGKVPSDRGVYLSTRECLHLISEGAETTGTNQGRVPSDWSLCAPTGECPHLISEGTETTGTRESVNQRRLCTHIHIPEEAYHKKEWVEAGNIRIPPGRGNPPTKETPTDKKRRR